MILFYGRPDDAPLELAIVEAVARGVPHVVIDQAHLARAEIVVDPGPGGIDGFVEVARERLPLHEISAVYARPLGLPDPASPEHARAQAANAALIDWLDLARCLVVNPPSAMSSNGSKPYQAQLIARCGLPVPATLVTNDPEAVRAFHAEHGRVVFKSISGIRSIVRELDAAALGRLDRVAALPTQFQAHVPGVDVRVHVVGERVFPTVIESGALDYRYARRDGLSARLRAGLLPDEVAERCTGVACALGLAFCGIDLRLTPDGEYVCFEVNPMPAYSYFQIEGGQDIAGALVDLLARAC